MHKNTVENFLPESIISELLGKLQPTGKTTKVATFVDVKKGIPQEEMNQKQRENLVKETIYARDVLHQFDTINFIMTKIAEDTGLQPGRASCNMLALRWIVSNAFDAVRKEKKGFRLSVDKNQWAKNFQLIGNSSFVKVTTALINAEYLIKNSGTKGQFLNPKTNRYEERPYVTTFTLAHKFFKLMRPYYMQGFKDLADSYFLFRDVDKNLIEDDQASLLFAAKAEYLQQNELLRSLDEILKNGRVFHNGFKKREFGYKRQLIVNETGEHVGGRIYASSDIQSLKQCDRLANLRIDGEEVTELDFASTHPRIVATLEGIEEDFDDPYTLDIKLFNKKLNRELYKDEQRNLVKVIANAAFNASAENLLNAVRWQLVCANVDSTNEIAVSLIQAFIQKSPWLEKHLGTSAWGTLQGLDSMIALKVIDEFVAQGEVILPYHDSFIVKASLEKELRRAMRKAWVEVLGTDKLCKVDKKHTDDEFELLYQELNEEFQESMLFS